MTMGHHTAVLIALAEREQAARNLSRPAADVAAPHVTAAPTRQPQDVVMARWLSAWLVSYWLMNAPRK